MIKSAMPEDVLLRPFIPKLPQDDSPFIDLVNRAVVGELGAKAVQFLFVIRIDNWFDRKWLNFAGIGRIAFGQFGQYDGIVGFNRDTVLDEFHKVRMKSTFPPFTPHRVVAQDFYEKDDTGSYVLDEAGTRIYSTTRRRSASNLNRRIVRHSSSSLYVWFSSNTLVNGRGSLMVYRANGTIITSWYSSFSRDGDWRILQTERIGRQHLSSWLASPILPTALHRD